MRAEGKIDTAQRGVDLDSDRQQTGCPRLRWSFTLHFAPPSSSLATCLSENNSDSSGRADLAANGERRHRCPDRIYPRYLHSHFFLLRLRALLATGICCRYGPTSAPAAQTQLSLNPGASPALLPSRLSPQRSHLHGCSMATFVCRVQFLDDTDPFNSTNFPEPTRPPLYTFREDIPLINQLAGVHRLLKAPHKVGLSLW